MSLKNKKFRIFRKFEFKEVFFVIITFFISFQFLILNPISIFLERDLQLNGKIVIGDVIKSKVQRNKGNPYRELNVSYVVDGIKYSNWFKIKHSYWLIEDNSTIFQKTYLIYSSLSPKHSFLKSEKNNLLLWNDIILTRLFFDLIFGLFFLFQSMYLLWKLL